MTMTPGVRRFALTAHVTASVGWLGAVAAFLALAVVGLTSRDALTVRAVYLGTELITWFVIVPLALASVLTGVIQSLGTTWGLLRHYWVLVKLVITVPATLLLLLHTQPIGFLARIAEDGPLSGPHVGEIQLELVIQAGGAVLVLLVATALSVYKPPGRTPLGR